MKGVFLSFLKALIRMLFGQESMQTLNSFEGF